MPRKITFTILFASFFHVAFAYSQTADRYPFDSMIQQEQFAEVLYEVRCMVCQNQNLADSNAPLAEDLRQEIYQQVMSGKSKEETIEYLTSRYGDFVLYRPPLNTYTWLLWTAPFGALVLGLCILFLVTRRRG